MDNICIDVTPFKGPFKGKGANRKSLQILKDDLAVVESAMREAVSEFNELFPPLGPRVKSNQRRRFKLVIHRPRGVPQLWWRVASLKSNFIKIFDNEAERQYLLGLMPATFRELKRLDELRLELNFKASILANAIEFFTKYVDGVQQLEDFEAVTNFKSAANDLT